MWKRNQTPTAKLLCCSSTHFQTMVSWSSVCKFSGAASRAHRKQTLPKLLIHSGEWCLTVLTVKAQLIFFKCLYSLYPLSYYPPLHPHGCLMSANFRDVPSPRIDHSLLGWHNGTKHSNSCNKLYYLCGTLWESRDRNLLFDHHALNGFLHHRIPHKAYKIWI